MKTHLNSQYLNIKVIYKKQLVLTNKHKVTKGKQESKELVIKAQDFSVY